MKKLALLMAILMVALIAASFPMNAASTPILKGTPEIDGVLDDIYLQSASYTVDTTNDQVYKQGAEYTDAKDFKATTYILYDDAFIYFCTEVTDKTLVSCGKDVIEKNGKYTWQNDVVEMWSSLDGGTTWAQFNYDAFGLQLGIGSDQFTDNTKLQGAATKGSDSYVVEARMPHNLKDGAEFIYNVQINNIFAADASKIVCIGAQKKTDLHVFKMSGEEVIDEVIEEETEAPAAAEKAAEAPKTTAAKTADIMTVALIALAISGSGVIVSKKRK